MMIVITLKKEYLGKGKGDLIKVSEDHAHILVKEGIAETYDGYIEKVEVKNKVKSKKLK